MNVADVTTRVRRTFGDEAAVQVSDDDIIRWINDAQVAVVMNNDGALQKTDLIDLVATQAQYTLPADLLILRALRYKFTGMLSFSRLKYMSMQQFDESIDGWDGASNTAGYPQFFTMDEGKVILFPIPDQSVVDGLKVIYNQRPVDVTGALDTLTLPLIYHNSIVSYCMWQASLLDEDHEPAMMYKATFQEGMDKLITRETQDPNATYPVITVLQDDY